MGSARPVFKVRDRERAGTVSTSETKTETLIHEYSRPRPGKCVFSRPRLRPRPGKWSRPRPRVSLIFDHKTWTMQNNNDIVNESNIIELTLEWSS